MKSIRNKKGAFIFVGLHSACSRSLSLSYSCRSTRIPLSTRVDMNHGTGAHRRRPHPRRTADGSIVPTDPAIVLMEDALAEASFGGLPDASDLMVKRQLGGIVAGTGICVAGVVSEQPFAARLGANELLFGRRVTVQLSSLRLQRRPRQQLHLLLPPLPLHNLPTLPQRLW
jgi:hypothetical protein